MLLADVPCVWAFDYNVFAAEEGEHGGVDEEVRSGEGSEGSGVVQSDVPVCCSAGYD